MITLRTKTCLAPYKRCINKLLFMFINNNEFIQHL